jgi:hypothetical protein
LGDILVARGLVSEADVQRAVEYQTKSGGRLGDILVAMRAISQETIEAVLHDAPEAPKKIEATGVDGVELMKLMIKDMYVASRELLTQLAEDLGLTVQVVRELTQMAVDRKLIEAMGTNGKAVMELRYSLTETAAAGPPRRSSNAAMSASRPFRSRFQDASSARRSPTSASARKSCRSSSATSVVRYLPAPHRSGRELGRALLLYGPRAMARPRLPSA